MIFVVVYWLWSVVMCCVLFLIVCFSVFGFVLIVIVLLCVLVVAGCSLFVCF